MCYDRLMTIKTPCQENPDLWFSTNLTDIRLAQNICSSCPLKDKCYKTAVDNNEEFGIWGGVLFSPEPKATPEVKMCRSGKHPWVDGQITCKECRKETQNKYVRKTKRVYKTKPKKRVNILGGTCKNNHELNADTTTIRSNDGAVICKKCISGQKTRDKKADATRMTGSLSWR